MDEEIEEKLSTKSGDREVQVRVEAKCATAVLTACCPSSPPLVLELLPITEGDVDLLHLPYQLLYTILLIRQ